MRGVAAVSQKTNAVVKERLHEYDEERGILGGAAVPYFALHEDKVFSGKKAKVVEFLQTFGLNEAEAKGIVAAVGTAP
jgi:hypothetical protein